MQLRTTDRDAVVAVLETIAAASPVERLQFYVAEPVGGWLAVFPSFTPELERAESRARLVDVLADTTNVVFSSDLLRAFCEIAGIRNAFTSFDYLQRGEREGLEPPGTITFVPIERGSG